MARAKPALGGDRSMLDVGGPEATYSRATATATRSMLSRSSFRCTSRPPKRDRDVAFDDVGGCRATSSSGGFAGATALGGEAPLRVSLGFGSFLGELAFGADPGAEDGLGLAVAAERPGDEGATMTARAGLSVGAGRDVGGEPGDLGGHRVTILAYGHAVTIAA